MTWKTACAVALVGAFVTGTASAQTTTPGVPGTPALPGTTQPGTLPGAPGPTQPGIPGGVPQSPQSNTPGGTSSPAGPGTGTMQPCPPGTVSQPCIPGRTNPLPSRHSQAPACRRPSLEALRRSSCAWRGGPADLLAIFL
jgi:hypothetical protein